MGSSSSCSWVDTTIPGAVRLSLSLKTVWQWNYLLAKYSSQACRPTTTKSKRCSACLATIPDCNRYVTDAMSNFLQIALMCIQISHSFPQFSMILLPVSAILLWDRSWIALQDLIESCVSSKHSLMSTMRHAQFLIPASGQR